MAAPVSASPSAGRHPPTEAGASSSSRSSPIGGGSLTQPVATSGSSSTAPTSRRSPRLSAAQAAAPTPLQPRDTAAAQLGEHVLRLHPEVLEQPCVLLGIDLVR